MPWISRDRLDDLEARTESYAEFAAAARETEKAALGNSRRTAAQFDALTDEIRSLRTRLLLSDGARRRFVEQLDTLQRANEAQAAELLNHQLAQQEATS